MDHTESTDEEDSFHSAQEDDGREEEEQVSSQPFEEVKEEVKPKELSEEEIKVTGCFTRVCYAAPPITQAAYF